jgi:membrane-anchored protein YejM (alkaline phosphatase superfamily)
LQRRGELDKTLIVVTSDHGEGLGEHNLFDHGESLYRTEIRVPLVIIPPSRLDRPVVVASMRPILEDFRRRLEVFRKDPLQSAR